MPAITFLGYVLPEVFEIGCHGGPIQWSDSFRFSFSYTIVRSEVAIQCEIDAVNDIAVNYTHHVISAHLQAILDAISFSSGNALTLVLDAVSLPDGSKHPLQSSSPSLKAACSFDPQEIIRLLEKERRLMKPLRDLAHTLVDQLDSFIYCQRAIEGIGRLLSKEKDRKLRWQAIRESLNVSRKYLEYVSERSEPARHGATGPVIMTEIAEVQMRGWTVMNRFLEFRKRSNVNLAEPEFPRL